MLSCISALAGVSQRRATRASSARAIRAAGREACPKPRLPLSDRPSSLESRIVDGREWTAGGFFRAGGQDATTGESGTSWPAVIGHPPNTPPSPAIHHQNAEPSDWFSSTEMEAPNRWRYTGTNQRSGSMDR